MSEEKEILQEVLERAIESVDNATTFLNAQLPDVIRQLLLWELIYSLIVDLAIIGLVFGFLYSVYKGYNYISTITCPDSKTGHAIGGFTLMLISGILITIVSISRFNLNWLQILIAPKIFLIQYVTELFK